MNSYVYGLGGGAKLKQRDLKNKCLITAGIDISDSTTILQKNSGTFNNTREFKGNNSSYFFGHSSIYTSCNILCINTVVQIIMIGHIFSLKKLLKY